MKTVLKIVLFPISLVLSLLTSFMSFLVSISTSVLNILVVVLTMGAFVCLIDHDGTTCLKILVIAYLISPYGIHYLASKIVGLFENLNASIKAI